MASKAIATFRCVWPSSARAIATSRRAPYMDLMRVRAFTQDDAHIFCTEDQIESETEIFIDLLASIYRDFGFEEFVVKFSDRPDVRAGYRRNLG